eukprot:m.1139744 g.1139744  ORF g.1139744 m.1139744 type:complete len:843 (+) comp24442_c0_seq6:131-2659(+)
MPEVVPVPVIYPRTEVVFNTDDITIKLNNVKNPNAYVVYFTINGQAPDPTLARKQNSYTLRYSKPFTLSPGRHTVKAVTAPISLHAAASSVATKYFEVRPDGDTYKQGSRCEKERTGQLHVLQDVRLQLHDAMAELEETDTDTASVVRTNTDNDLDEREEDFYAQRRKRHVIDYGACDLCRTPWPKDPKILFCQLCGFKRPEAIATLEHTHDLARELSPVSPLRTTHDAAPHHNQPVQGTRPAPASPRPHAQTTSGTHPRRMHGAQPSVPGVAGSNDGTKANDRSCPYCGVAVGGSSRFCMACQNTIPVRGESADEAGPREHTNGIGMGNSKHIQPEENTTMLLCDGCKSYSPATSHTCFTCDAPLSVPVSTVKQVERHRIEKRVANSTQVMICKNCNRNNPKSSRFCNWCGFKAPIPTQQVIVCEECNEENLMTAKFCSTCGIGLPDPLDDRYTSGGGDHTIMQLYDEIDDGTVVHVADTANGTAAKRGMSPRRTDSPKRAGYDTLSEADRRLLEAAKRGSRKQKSVGVQTGLYFPSSQKLEASAKSSKARKQGDGYDRFKHLPTTSVGPPPASGDAHKELSSWRRQIDHMFMQLKAYARKKDDSHAARFQAEAMEFVMGEVTSASVRQDGDEVCLTVSLVDMALTPHRKKVSRTAAAECQTEPLGDSLAPLADILPRAPGKSSKPTRKRATAMSDVTKALLVEIGSSGQGRSDTVLGLLDEGADVNVLTREQQRPLHIAASAGRVEILKFLLDGNAGVDGKGYRGDTPLHAAVRGQASQAQQCISLLLDANADPHAKNADKLTPSALAGEIGNKRLVAFLGTKVAAPVLWNLSKSKMAPT